MEKNKVLYFNVHGFFQSGVFLREYSETAIEILVIQDDYNPRMAGKTTLILKAFLIDNPLQIT